MHDVLHHGHEKAPPADRRRGFVGVDDGTRTRDSQNHNLVLYQLNYTHQVPGIARLEELYPTVPAESNRYGLHPVERGDLRIQAGPSSSTAAVICSVDGPGAGTKAVLR